MPYIKGEKIKSIVELVDTITTKEKYVMYNDVVVESEWVKEQSVKVLCEWIENDLIYHVTVPKPQEPKQRATTKKEKVEETE